MNSYQLGSLRPEKSDKRITGHIPFSNKVSAVKTGLFYNVRRKP